MTSLYLASSQAYAGKTLIGLALAQRYLEKGVKVGYFKPIGALPLLAEAAHIDEDVPFIKDTLGLQEPAELLSPLVLTDDLIHSALQEPGDSAREKVRAAYEQVSRGKELMLVGGAGQALSRGALFGLSGPEIAELLDLKVLLIGDFNSLLDLDATVATAEAFGERLFGTVLNRVPEDRLGSLRGEIIPRLQAKGLQVLGALPADALLHSISLRELAESLGAKVLCAEDRLGELVENFIIGAMTLDSALVRFRQMENKAVITGGDRSDIIIAALQTPTTCLILTGNLPPSPAVKARAAELGVPMLLVGEDTISTVERIERLVSALRVREPRKLARARELVESCLDLTRLDALIGLGQ